MGQKNSTTKNNNDDDIKIILTKLNQIVPGSFTQYLYL